MVLLSLFFSVVPNAKTAFKGRLASAAQVMSLLVMVLLSLPVVVAVLKNTTPAKASVEEPFNVQYCTILELASPMKRMVEVPAVASALVLVMVKPMFNLLPVAFTLPSMVTLSAPLRLIKDVVAMAPVMLKPVVVG